MALSLPPLPDLPPLQLSPSMFPRRNYIPFGNEAKGMNPLAKQMEQTLTLQSGVGATCCVQASKYPHINHTRLTKDQLANLFDESCREAIDDVSSVYLKPTNEKFSYIYYSNSSMNISESVTHHDNGPGCKCSANGTWYLCSKGAAGKRPDELVTITMDTLQNITGRNMSKYLLYTTQAFRRHRLVHALLYKSLSLIFFFRQKSGIVYGHRKVHMNVTLVVSGMADCPLVTL